jgi:hypothetical protein
VLRPFVIRMARWIIHSSLGGGRFPILANRTEAPGIGLVNQEMRSIAEATDNPWVARPRLLPSELARIHAEIEWRKVMTTRRDAEEESRYVAELVSWASEANRHYEAHGALYLELEERARAFGFAARRELELPGTLLLVGEPDLFAEADRLSAEGELRLTVTAPITALIVLFSIQESPYWLAGLLAVLVLAYQGEQRTTASLRLTEQSFAFGRSELPSAKRFATWAEDFIGRARTDLADAPPPPPSRFSFG